MVKLCVPAIDAFVKVADVAENQYWHFEAEGQWYDAFVPCSPEGYSNRLAVLLGLPPEVPSAPLFALCGKILDANGNTIPESEFHIGRDRTIPMPASGTLVVFANDVDRFPIFRKNNKGSITVNAEPVLPPPASPPAPAVKTGHPLSQWWLGLVEAVRRTQGMILISALLFVPLYILACTPQGRDILTTVAEDDSKLTKVFLVVGLTYLGIQAWFWPRRIVEANFGYDKAKWGAYRALFMWWPRLLGVAPHIVAAYVILSDRHAADGGRMLLVVMLIVAVAFVSYLITRDKLIDMGNKSDRNPLKAVWLWWPLFGVFFSAAMFFAFTFAPATLGQMVGPAAIVFLAVAGVLPYAAILVQVGREFRLPVTLIFLILAVVSSNTNYVQHDVGRRTLEPSAPYMTSDPRPDLEQALEEWVRKSPPPVEIGGKKRLPLIIVATEGGASRAGYWTAVVMNALEQQSQGQFSQRTFAISSISGGSLGAVGWIATLNPPQGMNPDIYRKAYRWPVLKTFVGADSLSPALASSLFPSTVQRFVPFPLLPDGGEGLEEGWERSWRTATAQYLPAQSDLMRKPYLDLWPRYPASTPPEQKRWVPHLLIGGASEEQGDRVLTSSVRFRSVREGESRPQQIDARDFFRVSQLNINASTAISNGARFPWISPAGHVETDDGGFHIVDGGYFDASGIETARELLVWINTYKREVDSPAEIYPILVIINYREKTFDDGREKPNTFINDVMGPIIGLYSARNGHQSHMIQPVESAIKAELSPWAVRELTLTAEPYATLPMDWVLSSRARDIAEAKVGIPPRPYDKSAGPDIARLADLLKNGDAQVTEETTKAQTRRNRTRRAKRAKL